MKPAPHYDEDVLSHFLSKYLSIPITAALWKSSSCRYGLKMVQGRRFRMRRMVRHCRVANFFTSTLSLLSTILHNYRHDFNFFKFEKNNIPQNYSNVLHHCGNLNLGVVWDQHQQPLAELLVGEEDSCRLSGGWIPSAGLQLYSHISRLPWLCFRVVIWAKLIVSVSHGVLSLRDHGEWEFYPQTSPAGKV